MINTSTDEITVHHILPLDQKFPLRKRSIYAAFRYELHLFTVGRRPLGFSLPHDQVEIGGDDRDQKQRDDRDEICLLNSSEPQTGEISDRHRANESEDDAEDEREEQRPERSPPQRLMTADNEGTPGHQRIDAMKDAD